MKVGIIGGLSVGGLLGGALLNIGVGLVLCGLGLIAGCIAAIQEYQAEKREASWRRNYPSYKY